MSFNKRPKEEPQDEGFDLTTVPKSNAIAGIKSYRYLVVLETDIGDIFYYTVFTNSGRQKALDLARELHIRELPDDILLRVKEVSEIFSAPGSRGYDLIDPRG